MPLLDFIFGKKEEGRPDVRFGRFSDTYKSPGQESKWEDAMEKFEEGEIILAYRLLLEYLENPDGDNVSFREEGEKLTFELRQGSQLIQGVAGPELVRVESRVAEADSLGPTVLHQLLERNYELRYSRYGLNEDKQLVMLFDSYTSDGSPVKLFYALRELAKQADKLDDLLQDEYNASLPVTDTVYENLPEQEKAVKYAFLQKQIEQVLREVRQGKLDCRQYPGACTYLLLSTAYRLDYLLKPEGVTMETLERMHRISFSADNQKTIIDKNDQLMTELQNLRHRSREDFFREMYRCTWTFGITEPVPRERITDIIRLELQQAAWYRDNGYLQVALAIPDYIVGYCLFNYAPPPLQRELLHFYYEVTQPEFFKALGFSLSYYDPENGRFDKRSLRRSLRQIVERYPEESLDLDCLNCDSPFDFAHSYLLMTAAVGQ